MTMNREDAEDIYQDTFIRYAGKYPDQQSPALLFTVARSIFLDHIKKHRPETDTDADIQDDRTPEQNAMDRQGEDRVLRLFGMLEKTDREILSMAGQDGLSYKEIAEATGMTEANIKVRVHRARIKMKELLEKEK